MRAVRVKKRMAALFAAVLMFMLIFCMSSPALDDDALSYFGRMLIEGKDDWLFYSGDSSIEDYQGTDLCSGTELETLKKQLVTFRDALALRGCEFVILIAPNKEQVYWQYMPDSYGLPAVYTKARQICDYLTDSGITVIYPLTELREAAVTHPDYDVYYRRDTHWNELGAYIGAKSLLAALGIGMPPVEELEIRPIPHDSEDVSAVIGRDLEDTGYDISGYIDYSLDVNEALSDFLYHTSRKGVDERRVLMAGDSFAIALYPYLSQEFNDLVVCFDKTMVTPELIEAVQPDIYIYEVVERYLDLLSEGSALKAPASRTGP